MRARSRPPIRDVLSAVPFPRSRRAPGRRVRPDPTARGRNHRTRRDGRRPPARPCGRHPRVPVRGRRIRPAGRPRRVRRSAGCHRRVSRSDRSHPPTRGAADRRACHPRRRSRVVRGRRSPAAHRRINPRSGRIRRARRVARWIRYRVGPGPSGRCRDIFRRANPRNRDVARPANGRRDRSRYPGAPARRARDPNPPVRIHAPRSRRSWNANRRCRPMRG